MWSLLWSHRPVHTIRLTTLHQVQQLPTICLRNRNKIALYFGVRPMAFVSIFSQWCVLVPDCWRGLKSEGANNTGHIPRGWASSQLGLLPSAGLWESSETSGREFCTAVRRFEIRNVATSSKCCNCLVDWGRRGGCWKGLIQRQQRNLS